MSVYIPTPFRSFTGNRTHVEVEGRNVAELLSNLEAKFPGFRDLCCDDTGAIPAHINIYVNNKEIGALDGAATKLAEGDEVAVIPALAGGAETSSDGGTDGDDPSRYALTPERVTRYSRHLIMSQVGSVGQRKIFGAKVLIVGAGGLGSPAALYLALAGVGTLGLVDFDVVDMSNLQRQILHRTEDIGKRKVVSAEETIAAYNPDVRVFYQSPRNSAGERPLRGSRSAGPDRYDWRRSLPSRQQALDDAALKVERQEDGAGRNRVRERRRQGELAVAVRDDHGPVLADAERGRVGRVQLEELLPVELVRLVRAQRRALQARVEGPARRQHEVPRRHRRLGRRWRLDRLEPRLQRRACEDARLAG